MLAGFYSKINSSCTFFTCSNIHFRWKSRSFSSSALSSVKIGCSPSSSKSLFQYALNGQSSTDFPNEQRSKGIIKSAFLVYFSLNNISVYFVPVSPNSGKLQKKRGTVATSAPEVSSNTHTTNKYSPRSTWAFYLLFLWCIKFDDFLVQEQKLTLYILICLIAFIMAIYLIPLQR